MNPQHQWSKGTLPVRGEAPRAIVVAAHTAALRGVRDGGKKNGRSLPNGKAELRAARIASKRAMRATSGQDSFDPSLLLEALLAAQQAAALSSSAEEAVGGGSSSSSSSSSSTDLTAETLALSLHEESRREEESSAAVEEEGEGEEEEEEGGEGQDDEEEEEELEEEEEEETQAEPVAHGTAVFRTECLSAVSRSLALRLGSLLGWRGVESGSGGRKAKRRLRFTLAAEAAAAGPSEGAMEAALALCAKFAAELSGQALADTVARLKALRKQRHAAKASAQSRQGKVRFVAREDSESEEEEAAAPGPGAEEAASSRAGIAFVAEGSSASEGQRSAAAEGAVAAPGQGEEACQATSAAGTGTAAAAAAAAGPLQGVGEWEAHTKGFAARMLLKMGYKGGALGKEGGGAPTLAFAEVKANKGRLGLGGSLQ